MTASGWEDSYKWQTSGQFVDFATNPDGYYVLRVTDEIPGIRTSRSRTPVFGE